MGGDFGVFIGIAGFVVEGAEAAFADVADGVDEVVVHFSEVVGEAEAFADGDDDVAAGQREARVGGEAFVDAGFECLVEEAAIGVVGHRVGQLMEVGGDGGAPGVVGGFRRGGDGDGLFGGDLAVGEARLQRDAGLDGARDAGKGQAVIGGFGAGRGGGIGFCGFGFGLRFVEFGGRADDESGELHAELCQLVQGCDVLDGGGDLLRGDAGGGGGQGFRVRRWIGTKQEHERGGLGNGFVVGR